MRACVVLLVATACHQHHVRLDPPRAGITPDARVALFWKLRPTADGFVKLNGEIVNRTMLLGDRKSGVEPIAVVSPEDLEPLVGSDSETMRFARASVSARTKADVAWWTGIAVLAAGVVMSGYFGDEPPFGLPTAWIGARTALGGLVIAQPVSSLYRRAEVALRARAFDVYTRDLGTRLDVCAHGTQVVPCEGPTEPTPVGVR